MKSELLEPGMGQWASMGGQRRWARANRMDK